MILILIVLPKVVPAPEQCKRSGKGGCQLWRADTFGSSAAWSCARFNRQLAFVKINRYSTLSEFSISGVVFMVATLFVLMIGLERACTWLETKYMIMHCTCYLYARYKTVNNAKLQILKGYKIVNLNLAGAGHHWGFHSPIHLLLPWLALLRDTRIEPGWLVLKKDACLHQTFRFLTCSYVINVQHKRYKN